MNKGPNVIVILTDDQGFGDFACHGNPFLRTPNLDRLHDESVRLTDFHVDPMCAPSRAAFMTGRYSARTGVWSTLTGRYIMSREETTMAELFRDAGYRTAMFGKWHLGDTYPYRPMDRGFQESLTFGGGVVGEIPDWWNNDYFNATYSRNGKPERFSEYCTDLWFNQAMAFGESCDGDPFFCYIPTNAPHGPMDVHDRYRAPYLGQGIDRTRAGFFGMIENIDENVGRLRQRLEELGISEDTIITFGGDNGTSTGATLDTEGFVTDGYNAGMRGKKCWAYDGGHRNACMVHWPGGNISGGRDVDGLTAHIDLLPTLLDLCGIGPPDGIAFDGISLAGKLRGNEPSLKSRTLCVHNQQRDVPRQYKDLEVMTEDWRLAITEQWGPPGQRQLFAIKDDPEQRTDLLKGKPDVAGRLLGEYDRWWESVSVRFGEYSDIVIGAAAEPETKLTCHAWHDSSGLYNQRHVRPGPVDNGFWAVSVSRAGTYEIALRRWPKETDAAICATIPARTGVPFVHDLLPGAAIPVRRARIAIGSHRDECVIEAADRAAVFHMRLPAGPVRLQSWFEDAKGVERGAYYAYARRLGN